MVEQARLPVKYFCWIIRPMQKSLTGCYLSFQRIPLTYDEEKGAWFLEKELPVSIKCIC